MLKFLANLLGNFKSIFSSPLTLLLLIGCGILLIALIKFKAIKFDAKTIARIGLAVALAFILDMLKVYRLTNGGGSITPGSMIPILFISFLYGPAIGMFTGFCFGIFNLILDPYILNPVQVLFDYPLPFMMVGAAGFFKNKYMGTTFAMVLRFIFHFISGVAFFGSYAPDNVSPFIYSLTVNGIHIGGELIVCLVILAFLPINKLVSILNSKKGALSN